ncbi:sphingosine N-acyltransferase lag1, partial [Coelomomyces lativittatus]
MKKNTRFPPNRWHPPNLILRFINEHQIDLSLFILAPILLIAYFFPNSAFVHFIYPPHQVGVDQHDKGWWDIAFIFYYAVFWTFSRAVAIEYCFMPLAKALKCKKKLLLRFSEQSWLVLYYSISFCCGFAIYCYSPYFLNTRHFWIGYPHILLKSYFKSYYLVQISFWLQQLLVVHLEKPRKDHLQYIFHHLITCTLLTTSYLGNFTRIGHAVLTLMDVADIFLSGAKCLNYLKWRQLCDGVFVVFVFVWVFSRHYLYFYLVYSVWNDMPILSPLRWDPSTGFYASVGVGWFFLALFTALQALLIFWFALILNVVLKVVRGKGVEDNRSDTESDGESFQGPTENEKESSALDEKVGEIKSEVSIHSITGV